jgi:hypothetical protein
MTRTSYRDFDERVHSGFFNRQANVIAAVREGRKAGFYFADDFMSGGAAESSTAFAWTGGMPAMRYLAFGTASSIIKPLNLSTDDEIGVLTLDADADNDECYLTFDPTYNEAFGKFGTGADARPFMFESRCRWSNIASATATVAKMIGLRARVAAATADIPDGGATIKVEEFVGFRAVSGDGDGMDMVYVDSAEVVHGEAATYSQLVIEADTWYKFGLAFDGQYCRWYVDGRPIGDPVLPTATNFPVNEPLMPYFGCRLDGTDAANHADIDGWSFLRSDDLTFDVSN